MNSEQEKDRQEAKKGQLSPEGNKVKRAKETVAKRSDDEITDEEQRQMQAREELMRKRQIIGMRWERKAHAWRWLRMMPTKPRNRLLASC